MVRGRRIYGGKASHLNKVTTATGKSRPMNIKEQLVAKAKALWGDDAEVEVEATRAKGTGVARELAIPNGWYLVECKVNGTVRGRAYHAKWNRAYRGCILELEKSFTNELSKPTESV